MNKNLIGMLVGLTLLVGLGFLAKKNHENHEGHHDHRGHAHHDHSGHGHDHHDHHDHGKHEKGGHHHDAPHGGCLVVFGKEFAHLEFLVDAASGKCQAYVLDGEAKGGVRIPQESLALEVIIDGQKIEVVLKAMANPLSGEKVGDTSYFVGEDSRLKGLKKFGVVLKSIEIRGKKFENIVFPYPDGNE